MGANDLVARPPWWHLYKQSRWKAAKNAFLEQHPVCVICDLKLATVVDHIRPHRGDLALFWDSGNWQSLCVVCHNRKSAREKRGQANGQR